jgi:hypothetical protein
VSGGSMIVRQKILLDPVTLSQEDAALPLVDLIGQVRLLTCSIRHR